ncbi:MAG: hypothetical protein R6U17_02385, partial [Thermoplasmata archaeon]
FDCEFYTNDVIKTVKRLKEHFIMPVKKQGKAKEKIKESYLNGPLDYEMSDGAIYTMMTVKGKQKNKLLPYVTNLEDKPINIHRYSESKHNIESRTGSWAGPVRKNIVLDIPSLSWQHVSTICG